MSKAHRTGRPRSRGDVGRTLPERLNTPIDASLLAFVRIGTGSILCWELWRYIDRDLPRRLYVTPEVHFTFWPFDWIRPPSAPVLDALFIGMMVAAGLVALGAYLRTAALLLASGMTYVFLMDRSYYLNHWYLACLAVVLLALTPAASAWSVDARLAARSATDSAPDAAAERSFATVPAWSIGVLRFQVGAVYLFAGLSKIDADWLAGRPLEIWLHSSADFPLVGGFLRRDGVPTGLAVAAMILDVSAPVLLTRRATRRFTYPVVIAFHLMNSRLFTIGMFPWLMMILTAVFFPPDFPRRMLDDVRAGRRRVPTLVGAGLTGSLAYLLPEAQSVPCAVVGAVAGAIAGYHLADGTHAPDNPAHVVRVEPAPVKRSILLLLSVWVIVQTALPLRPYLYAGNAAWTEEGQQFSWRLLLRTKRGGVVFRARDPITDQVVEVYPERYLSEPQLNNLAEQPEMMVQFATWIEEHLRPSMSGHDLEVRATSSVSLNGRAPAPLVDPSVDLTEVSRPWFPPAPWILPEPPR